MLVGDQQKPQKMQVTHSVGCLRVCKLRHDSHDSPPRNRVCGPSDAPGIDCTHVAIPWHNAMCICVGEKFEPGTGVLMLCLWSPER